MDSRKHLLGGQIAVAMVTIATAVMAVIALHTTASRTSEASSHAFEDIALLERTRAHVADLTDATRTYLIERREDQRASLGGLQKQFASTIDQLAARGLELGVSEAWQIERDADGYVAWISRAAADGASVDEFERVRAHQRSAVDAELNAFAVAARRNASDALATATALAERAQLGVLFTSVLGITIGLVLAASAVRKQAVQLRRLRAAINSANRTAAARRELLDIAAAELRTSANAITLCARLLDEARIRETEQPHLVRMRVAAQRMEHILDNLRESAELASIERVELHYEQCNTRTLLGTCIEMFFARAKEQGIRIKTDSRDIATVSADPERLVQVFANLVMHSIQRTEPGGSITLSAIPEQGGVRFVVADTGPVLAPEVQPLVFERDRTSTGIALDVCRRIVEAHGGEVGVDSQPGNSAFWFTIPS
jgi:signal transduction histidine kinase